MPVEIEWTWAARKNGRLRVRALRWEGVGETAVEKLQEELLIDHRPGLAVGDPLRYT